MGLIQREDYVCDYCENPVNGGPLLVGRLTLRRLGARGLGRQVNVVFHPTCVDELNSNADRGGRPEPAGRVATKRRRRA